MAATPPDADRERAGGRRRRKWIVRVAVVAALAGGAALLRATVLAPDPLAVRVVRVERGRVEASVSNSKAGSVLARRRAGLSPETSGAVASISRREGERVRAGETILELDGSAQRAELALAERGLEVAEAELARSCIASERSRRELDRIAGLSAERIVSADLLDEKQSALDLALAACGSARAEVGAARAQVDRARVALAKTVLRAPFDGVIAELDAEVGEWVTPAPPMVPVPPAVDLLDPTSLYVAAPIDEVDSGRVRVGQAAKVTLDPFPGRAYAGRVVRVAPYVLDVERQNRTVEVEVELDDREFAATLLPGTSADVEVVLETRDSVLRVPAAAVGAGGRALVLAGGRLEAREVEAGLANWEHVEVRAGLAEGELVVVSLERAGLAPGARAVALEEPP